MLAGGKKLRRRGKKTNPGDWFVIGSTYETPCSLCRDDDDDSRFLAKADGESPLRACLRRPYCAIVFMMVPSRAYGSSRIAKLFSKRVIC
jgi:hypothetical protein